MTAPYSPSMSKIYWGTAAALRDLTPHLDSTFTTTCNTVVDRRRRITDTGLLGQTADGVRADFASQGSFERSDDVLGCIADRSGFLWLERIDADHVICYPATVTAVPITSPAAGIVGYQVSFAQQEGPAPVQGTLDTTPANKATAQGMQAYHRDSAAIAAIPAGSSVVVADGDGYVVGVPIIAEVG